jgi:tetratricopeptide (TPR) repeat protein
VGTESSSGKERLPGLKLPDRYRLGRHIATGGMASVWWAEDLVLGRPVAIKVISERFARDHAAVSRFEREARTAARVSGHPHVVTIYDVGEAISCEAGASPTPRTFIVMEHLAGGTVADALRVGEVRLQEALRWLREASSALDHAHAAGIVHRDIKPANFLLDGARVLHVADFGIARLGGEDTLTGSGELFGTAAYLSPEQALGRAASPASDRYALAVAAYELLVGQRPFNAAHFTAQARQHIEQPPPAASERNRVLPPAVDAVLQRGLAKQPEARYATAAAFVDGLDVALSPSRPRVTRRRVSTANGRSGPATGATRRAATANQRSAPAMQAARVSGDTAAGATRALAIAPAAASGWAPSSSAGAVIPASEPEQLPDADGAGAGDRVRQPLAGGVAGNRGRRRAIALGALATAALGVGALAAGTQGSGHGTHGAGAGARARDTRLASRLPARRAPRHASPATTPVQTADTLEAKGHELMLDGAYSAAIPTLRQAVSVAPPQSLTYGYALYDLGRSLVLSGDPRAAVPILERRLLIPNQTQVVQQMLQLALRDSSGGTGVTSSSSSTTNTASSTSTSTTGAPPPTTTTTTTITAPIPHRGGPARSDTGSGGAGLGVAPGAVTHAHAQDQRAREQRHGGQDHRTAAHERRARRASAHHHDRATRP